MVRFERFDTLHKLAQIQFCVAWNSVIINKVLIILLQRNRDLVIEGNHWDGWTVTAACPITISINGSSVSAVCQNASHTGYQNDYQRHGSSHFNECRQVNYCHKPESSHVHHVSCVHGHPVGCVSALRVSVIAREKPVREPVN